MTVTKNPMNSGEEKKEGISIESQKVIQGMSLVFTGALTMLEAIHPCVTIEPKALLHLLTGNVDNRIREDDGQKTLRGAARQVRC